MEIVIERIKGTRISCEVVRLAHEPEGGGNQCRIVTFTTVISNIILYEVIYGTSVDFRRTNFISKATVKIAVGYFRDILLAHATAIELVEKQYTVEEARVILHQRTS